MMTVKELIEVLESLPSDYEAIVGSGHIVAVWISHESKQVDIDYSNDWHRTENGDPSFQYVFNASPETVISG